LKFCDVLREELTLKRKNLATLRKTLALLGSTFLGVTFLGAVKLQASSSDTQSTSKPGLPEGNKKSENQAASPSKGQSNSAALPTVDPKTYKIGVEDELMISVWREPELSTQVVVRPDGKITLPLINDVEAVGLRTDELQNLLTEKFKPYVNTPQVTVIVRGIRSRRVNLIGNVARQGTFDLNDNKTVLDLIAQAGGLGAFAKAGSIYILRQSGGKQVRIGFDYKKAIAGKGPNPELQPGDLVVVP
jgi:polysaccharide export outer membrane protein